MGELMRDLDKLERLARLYGREAMRITGDQLGALVARIRELEQDAARWRTFEGALRTGRIQGSSYGRRFKVIETCPMSGDESEFSDLVAAIDAARKEKGHG